MTFQQFLLILRARRKVLLGVWGFVVLIAVAISLLLPKQYTAEAVIAIDTVKLDPISNMPMSGQLIPGYLATQVDILTSHETALKVVDQLGLDQLPEANKQFVDDTEGKGSLRDWLADNLLKNIEVKPSRESNAISLSYTSPDPAFASTMANSFIDAYKQINIDMRSSSAQQNNLFFREQLDGLQKKLELAQSALSDYQQAQGIVATDERLDIETQRLAEISSQLVATQGQSIDANSRIQNRQNIAPDVLNNPLIQQQKSNIAQLEGKLRQMAVKEGPNHPQYQQAQAELSSARAQMEGLVRQYTAGLANSAENTQQRLEQLNHAQSQQKERVLQLKKQRSRLDILQRSVDSAQRVYDLAMQRLAESAMESNSNATNIAILKAAPEPVQPSKPKTIINLILAFFSGFLLGVGSALILEIRDRRARSAFDVEQALNLPMLADMTEKNSFSSSVTITTKSNRRVKTA